MSVTIKSAREIELMRAAGKILAKVHQNLGHEIKPGMSTWDINRLGDRDDPRLRLCTEFPEL